MRRGLATFLVFFAVLIAGAGFVSLLGSMLAGQIIQIVEDFPQYLDSVINWINDTFSTELSRVEVQDSLLRSDWLRQLRAEQRERRAGRLRDRCSAGCSSC